MTTIYLRRLYSAVVSSTVLTMIQVLFIWLSYSTVFDRPGAWIAVSILYVFQIGLFYDPNR